MLRGYRCIYVCCFIMLTVRLILLFWIYVFNLKVLLKAVHWLFPDFALMWLVEEAKKNMPLELDFLNEGRNAEKVADMLAHFHFLKVLIWACMKMRLPFRVTV